MSKDSPKSNNSSGSKKKRANHHRHQQHQKTIKFRCDYSSTPLKVLQSRGWSRIHDSQDSSWDLWWCDTSDLRQALDAQRLRPQQRVSHFRNHCELTRKNYLYRNLKRYRRLLLKAGKTKEAELCDAMPISFELPSEYRMLIEEHRKKHGTTWIVKPSQGSQGRGIFLFQRLRDLVEWKGKECVHPSSDLADYEPGKEQPSQMNYLVQKYIDDPYLIDGRSCTRQTKIIRIEIFSLRLQFVSTGCKFDLRLYVLVTSFQPLKVWLAREGFARLSGEQFSLERIDDNRVHLTNMSIQLRQPRASSSSVNNDAGDKDCEVKLGRKWPLSCLKKYLSDRHGERVIDQLIHNIAVTMKIQVIYQNEKVDFCPNEDGYLTLKALRERFPKTDGLSFKNSEGKRIILIPCDERIKINQSVDVYDVHTEIHLGDDDDYVPAVKKSKSVDNDEICIIEAKNGNGNVTDKENDHSKSVDDKSVESHDVEMKSEVDEMRDDKKSDDAQEKNDSSDDKMDEDITAVDSKPEIEESKQIDSSESQLADKTDDVAKSEQEQLVTDEKSADKSAPIVEIKKYETHDDVPQEKEINFETESESKIDTDLTDSQVKSEDDSTTNEQIQVDSKSTTISESNEDTVNSEVEKEIVNSEESKTKDEAIDSTACQDQENEEVAESRTTEIDNEESVQAEKESTCENIAVTDESVPILEIPMKESPNSENTETIESDVLLTKKDTVSVEELKCYKTDSVTEEKKLVVSMEAEKTETVQSPVSEADEAVISAEKLECSKTDSKLESDEAQLDESKMELSSETDKPETVQSAISETDESAVSDEKMEVSSETGKAETVQSAISETDEAAISDEKMEVSSEMVEPVTSEAKKDTVEEDSKEDEEDPKDVSTRDATEQKTKFSPSPSRAAIETESNVTNSSEGSDSKTEAVSRPKIGSCRQNSADHKCVPKIENGIVVMKCSEECHTEAMVETKVGLVYESVTSEFNLKSTAKKEESSDDSVESEKSSGDDEKDNDNDSEESELSNGSFRWQDRGDKLPSPPQRSSGGKHKSPPRGPRRRCGIISDKYKSPPRMPRRRCGTISDKYKYTSDVDTSESDKGSPATPKQTRGRQSRSASKTPKLLTKVLRVGWLNRATPNDKYEPMEKPLGLCQKLKLTENKIYTALDIKQMAMKKFTGRKNFDLEELYDVQLGHVGTGDEETQTIDEFAKPDGSICDIWGYCRANNTTPYKLKLSLLTTAKNPNRTIVATPARSRSVRRICSAPTRPVLQDNVRIYYEYQRTSKYTNDRSVTEMEIDELLVRVREDNHGEGPEIIDNFDPLNFGYTISRLEVDGKQLLHVTTEDDGRLSYEYHESVVDPEPHRILFDTDVVSGACRGQYGVGVVLSCTHRCSPVITWYKDDAMIKEAEQMYWIRDVFDWLDDETHVWHCTIKCKEMKKPLRSKNAMINQKTVTQRSSRVGV
uniref:Tubulin--tyrosine ligase-like protein 9 n=1 Tax=Trichogramma kaykai TaxID=54128 RepID=A0ABD2VY72_9HYME